MKTLIAASLMLALIVPAHAAELTRKDRYWHPTVEQYQVAFGQCLYAPTGTEDGDEDCKARDKLGKKLKAEGYCLVGKAEVGRPSKDRKHCYTIDFPDEY